ncbi:hypothetical protein CGLO_05419 [Colletotrichum gloeosporioides Cg-14]|uniref:Uncharacterized protein n=1 Tax=Colletotrichum gloeosporioides (strain Cg-14) TaxID=1237896 RepID=T0KRJ6_COLGC|nr:hypothetical protein CGLO_05419 [Colletotrichum gloeosporioides Cg-14]
MALCRVRVYGNASYTEDV